MHELLHLAISERASDALQVESGALRPLLRHRARLLGWGNAQASRLQARAQAEAPIYR